MNYEQFLEQMKEDLRARFAEDTGSDPLTLHKTLTIHDLDMEKRIIDINKQLQRTTKMSTSLSPRRQTPVPGSFP